MKSVKLIFAAAAVAIATTAMAEADSIIYWMVDNPIDIYTSEAVEFSYVKIKSALGDAGYLNMYDPDLGDKDADRAYLSSEVPGYSTGYIYSGLFDGASMENSYFLVELYDGSGSSPVAWQRIYYNDALSSGSIAKQMASGGASAYSITQVVPEPTSGILLLLGFAGLALRRKKA